MKLTSWPEVAAINQKNYYTYATCSRPDLNPLADARNPANT